MWTNKLSIHPSRVMLTLQVLTVNIEPREHIITGPQLKFEGVGFSSLLSWLHFDTDMHLPTSRLISFAYNYGHLDFIRRLAINLIDDSPSPCLNFFDIFHRQVLIDYKTLLGFGLGAVTLFGQI